MTVLVYGSVGCGNCVRAKAQLHRAGVEYSDITIDEESKSALETQFGTLPRSLPFIVNDGVLYNFNQVADLIKTIKG